MRACRLFLPPWRALCISLLVGVAGPLAAQPAEAPPGVLAADTPMATTAGDGFIAPVGWRLSVRGPVTELTAPEGGSAIALVDVPEAADADAAVAAAWAAWRPGLPVRTLRVKTPVASRDGWRDRHAYSYLTSPNENRAVEADVRRANQRWTVVLYDMANDVGEKRGAQVNLIYGKLLPQGYQRERFAGRQAKPLDAGRVAELSRFVRSAMAQTGVPGVALGLVQDGRVVFADGFGVRQLGRPEPVDGDTRFLVASNTKALATLMLATLVDQGRIRWDTPATDLLPTFRLGDAQTTRQVQVRHLICACTGMPRQDMEWLLEFQGLTAAGALGALGQMQPTSGFGELFQYSNPMAAAAGYIGGHVAHPTMELGAAYDRAMQARVFGPLGMRRTTHDFDQGRRGNAAVPHAPDVDGRMTLAVAESNRSMMPVRPAGGAWSSVRDMLRYVQMELSEGLLPDGRRYIGREALLARRTPQVSVSTDLSYGMGLQVNTVYGMPLVHHGGDMIGMHSDMMWLPEQGVGAVILTNGDPGWLIRSVFRRKWLEVLFDGQPEADALMATQSQAFWQEVAAERRLLTHPADPAVAAALAPRYHHPALGSIRVLRRGGELRFDFGEFAVEMASRANPDGSRSVVSIAPGFGGLEFVLGEAGGQRTLTLRDAQHTYVLQAMPR
jgi:CubicO group peptidase (beta-lactamase class C family)